MIIESLKEIHAKHRLSNGDVSAHTKSAIKITKEWQAAVCNESILSEVSVSPQNAEKIDIVDLSNNVAFELKVSGNNTHHEFYKDLIKILTYNEYQTNNDKLTKLVFISESKGIKSLSNRLDAKFLTMLKNTHRISVELTSI